MESNADRPLLVGRLEVQYETAKRRAGEKLIVQVDPYRSAVRFASRYGRVSTRTCAQTETPRFGGQILITPTKNHHGTLLEFVGKIAPTAAMKGLNSHIQTTL